MPELLGIETSLEACGYSSRIKIDGAEATDALGQVICQSSIRFQANDGTEKTFDTLDLSLQLTPETIEPIFSGAAWAGTVLWRAAVSLIDVALLTQPFAAGSTVIELGCGLGVPGMVCAQLNASLVVLTEQENLVDLANRNVDNNFQDRSKIICRELDWSAERATDLRDDLLDGKPFDLIICCDCVYIPLYGDSWKYLVEAIDALGGPDSKILIAVERRFVRGATDGVDLFMHAMASKGFQTTMTFPTEKPLEIYEFQRRQ